MDEQMDTMEERLESNRGPVGKENLRLVLSLNPDAVASTTFSLSCSAAHHHHHTTGKNRSNQMRVEIKVT